MLAPPPVIDPHALAPAQAVDSHALELAHPHLALAPAQAPAIDSHALAHPYPALAPAQAIDSRALAPEQAVAHPPAVAIDSLRHLEAHHRLRVLLWLRRAPRRRAQAFASLEEAAPSRVRVGRLRHFVENKPHEGELEIIGTIFETRVFDRSYECLFNHSPSQLVCRSSISFTDFLTTTQCSYKRVKKEVQGK